MVQDRIKELEQRKKTQKYLANHYYYMNHPYIDNHCRSMAMRSYQAAWNMFRKVHNSGTPKFRKKDMKKNIKPAESIQTRKNQLICGLAQLDL